MSYEWTVQELAFKLCLRPSTVQRFVDEGRFTLARSSVTAWAQSEQGSKAVRRAIAIDSGERTESLIHAAGEDCGPRADLEAEIHDLLYPRRTSHVSGAES